MFAFSNVLLIVPKVDPMNRTLYVVADVVAGEAHPISTTLAKNEGDEVV